MSVDAVQHGRAPPGVAITAVVGSGVKRNAGRLGRAKSHRPVARAGRPVLRPDAGRSRRRGDQGRAAAGRRDATWGPPFDADGISAYFAGINRNKRTMALDLSKPEGREVLLKLLADADVLIENFKTGTMEKWGIGYDALSQSFPRLVHAASRASAPTARSAASRATTPWCRPRPAWCRSTARPRRAGADRRAGGRPLDRHECLIGILMALHERNASGKGQFVDATLYDSAIALHQPHAPNYFMAGRSPSCSATATATSRPMPTSRPRAATS